ncbi:MAG: hypothetical protein JXM79_21320 [Sedimentisphaerales bacterium]|nr:hypothetical protein [Sedimentisphaerales bacterium]
MKSVIHYRIQVLTAGFIVLLFFSLPLFCLRFLCEISLLEIMPSDARSIVIQPSGLVPSELEDDPNVVHHSLVAADLYRHPMMHLGLFDYFTSRSPEGGRSNVYFIESDEAYMYLDKKSGQLLYRDIDSQTMPDKSKQLRRIQFYVGPEGISELPNQTFGRFDDPIVEQNRSRQYKKHERIVYHKKQQRFLKIDFDRATVTQGPDISKKHPDYNPIQIGFLSKNRFAPNITWVPPRIKDIDATVNEPNLPVDQRVLKPIIPSFDHSDAGPYLLVLDKSGRIDLLDKQTLDFAGTAGYLPGPETYFGTMPSVTPKDLLSYTVHPLVLNKFYRNDGTILNMSFGDPYDPERLPNNSRIEREYLGMYATGISRTGTAMALAVYNAEGKRINAKYTRLPQSEHRYKSYLQSSKATLWSSAWAPALTIGKFLAENLHPPVLSIASYFTTSTFEAGAGHRALFLLPNSFVAMISRDSRENWAERVATALWWVIPSIILAIWLAWRVGKDATFIGFSPKARRRWIVGTVAFGLPAYITYKLTRPKTTLVTCINCGKLRRPDMEKCHHCNSPWHIPERTPPAWRVLDEDIDEGDQNVR